MDRRTLLGGAMAAAALGMTSVTRAEEGPIKIGMSMPQTGGLAAGGKASPGGGAWSNSVGPLLSGGSPGAAGVGTGSRSPQANPPTVTWEGFQAEPFVLKNHEQVRQVLAEAHQTVFGAALQDRTSTGTADNRFFGLYAGLPALVYGPQSDDIHGFDERVNLDSVRKITQATALFVAEWCGLAKI